MHATSAGMPCSVGSGRHGNGSPPAGRQGAGHCRDGGGAAEPDVQQLEAATGAGHELTIRSLSRWQRPDLESEWPGWRPPGGGLAMDCTIVDVFAERPLSGNQLAVVRSAGGLDAATM